MSHLNVLQNTVYDNKYFVTSKRQNDSLKFSLVSPCDALHIISHTVILHCMSINSNNTQISLLKKQLRKDPQRVSQILHIQTTQFFSTFYIIIQVFMKRFPQIIRIILNLDSFASILSTFFKKISLVSLT